MGETVAGPSGRCERCLRSCLQGLWGSHTASAIFRAMSLSMASGYVEAPRPHTCGSAWFSAHGLVVVKPSVPDGTPTESRTGATTEAARGSFVQATDRVNDLAGVGVGDRQVVESAIGAAADIVRGKAAAYLRYDTTSATGRPFATGVTEGACRHQSPPGPGPGLARGWALLGLRGLLAANHQARYRSTLIPLPDQPAPSSHTYPHVRCVMSVQRQARRDESVKMRSSALPRSGSGSGSGSVGHRR